MSTRRPLISLTDGPRLHPFRERNQKRPRGFNQALYITHDFIRSNVPVVRIVRYGSKWRMTMTKRRAFRDGGIVARGENSWRLRYRISGKRFTKTVHGTKSEAQKALRDLLHSGDTGEHVAPDKMTLGQWIDHWVSDVYKRQPFTMVMIATEMPAAIRPYSMAVAALSSLRNLMTKCMSEVLRQKSPAVCPFILKILREHYRDLQKGQPCLLYTSRCV